MSIFELEKPDMSEAGWSWFKNQEDDIQKQMVGLYGKANYPKYLYWDKIKHFDFPDKIRPIDFWVFTRRMRKTVHSPKTSLVKSENSTYFSWIMLEKYHYWISEFDKVLAGSFSSLQQSDDYKNRIIKVKWVMEESIASAQLEGAHTTRDAAKKMLQEDRKPKNNSEQMIINNYKTMLAIENEFNSIKLDRSALFQMHEMLVKDTDIKEGDLGRFRTDADKVMVMDTSDGTIYHIPPKESFLQAEIDRLLAYANDEIIDPEYVHPIIKAIIIHFWIGYLHPFVDGNGRLARALFYWYLIKQGYWGISLLPLSVMIKKSPKQYGMAYVYSEQDDNDLTYFIDYNMRKLKQAKEFLDSHIERQRQDENALAGIQDKFNNRQTKLIIHLAKNPNSHTTIKTHSTIYQISRITAKKDLANLQETGYLRSNKIGREVRYYPTDKLKQASTKNSITL
ncbi:MAG: Fic family protein [candidate division Zixibacteria bacterium]|nr:Fic family protein [candidate division Zixibacteria bacterium]